VLVAIGINWAGRRRVLGVELAGRESASTWRDFLVELKERGLRGVRLAMSDPHAGLKQSHQPTAAGSRVASCYVHFLSDALDRLPRKADDDCLTELRWLYDLRAAGQARLHLQRWLAKWAGKYGKLCDWVEANIEESRETPVGTGRLNPTPTVHGSRFFAWFPNHEPRLSTKLIFPLTPCPLQFAELDAHN
jgi:putative transposase